MSKKTNILWRVLRLSCMLILALWVFLQPLAQEIHQSRDLAALHSFQAPSDPQSYPPDPTSEIAWLGGTSWPGLGSNTVLAGHVTVAGLGNGPFRYLDSLPVGEMINLFSEENVYTYQVRQQVTVSETDVAVTLPTVGAQLTLITCSGWDDDLEIYRERRVVIADLVRTEAIVRQGNR